MPRESRTSSSGARRTSRIGTGRGRTRFSGSTGPKESRPGRSAAPLRRIGPRTPQASWPRAVGRTARRSSCTTAGTRELVTSKPSRRQSVRRAILSPRTRYKGTGERMPRLLSSYGEKLSSVTARVAQAVERTPLRRADSLHAPTTEGARWPPYAPFCSDYVWTPLFPNGPVADGAFMPAPWGVFRGRAPSPCQSLPPWLVLLADHRVRGFRRAVQSGPVGILNGCD